MPRLRVSAISFLNTAPLMWDFDHGDLRRQYEVAYTLPAACAELLRAGMADIGIIPVAAYTTIPGLVVIPEVAIAAQGAVRSILLISKVPLENISSIATDTSSRTSVALVQTLFAKFYHRAPQRHPMPPALRPMLAECDAGLLIGDPALLAKTDGYHVYDLAEEWKRLTGKPFVFAFWAMREAALQGSSQSPEIARAFQQSRDHGLEPQNLDRIAREWSRRLKLSEAEIVRYLTENIYYSLDRECMDGLELFYRYAAGCGALPEAPKVRFLDAN